MVTFSSNNPGRQDGDEFTSAQETTIRGLANLALADAVKLF